MEIKLEQIVGLLVRCFAISLFVSMVFQTQFFINTAILIYFQQGHFVLGIYGVVFLLVMLCIVLFLWEKPLFVAGKLIPVSEMEKPVNISVTLEELQSLCFSVIGFWILLGGIDHALRDIVHIDFARDGSWKTEIDYTRGRLGHVQALIGAGAMIGARGISKGVKKLRGQ